MKLPMISVFSAFVFTFWALPSMAQTSECHYEEGFFYLQQETKTSSFLDVILVIDNSSSMGPHQSALSENIHTLVDKMLEKGIDFKLAITTSDKKILSHDELDSKLAVSNPKKFQRLLSKRIEVGTKGSSDERSLESLGNFLNRAGASMIRPESQLLIYFLSDIDSEPKGNTSVSNLYDLIRKYKDPQKVMISGALGDQYRKSYEELQSRFSGSYFPIKGDFQDGFLQLNQQVSEKFRPQVKVKLSYEPVRADFQILKEDSLLDANSLQLEFDPTQRTVNVVFPENTTDSQFTIRYPVPCPEVAPDPTPYQTDAEMLEDQALFEASLKADAEKNETLIAEIDEAIKAKKKKIAQTEKRISQIKTPIFPVPHYRAQRILIALDNSGSMDGWCEWLGKSVRCRSLAMEGKATLLHSVDPFTDVTTVVFMGDLINNGTRRPLFSILQDFDLIYVFTDGDAAVQDLALPYSRISRTPIIVVPMHNLSTDESYLRSIASRSGGLYWNPIDDWKEKEALTASLKKYKAELKELEAQRGALKNP